MSKFTKGPWQVLPEEADKDYIRIRGTVLGGRYKVANVPTPVYAGVHPREVGETRANAALIAAAPELLAALEVAAGFVSEVSEKTGFGQVHTLKVIQAAIAKAKGGKA